MKAQIEQRLQALIGLKLTNNAGAANMEMLHFGIHSVKEKNGFITGHYRLHVQCPWRIIQAGKIFVAYFDLYEPDEAQKDLSYEEFDYCKGNVRDEKMHLLTKERPHLKVERVEADNLGGFTLYCTQDARLEVIPMHSSKVEYWRLIAQDSKSHFVVEAEGVRA